MGKRTSKKKRRHGKTKRRTATTHFVAASSGQLLGHLVDACRLRRTKDLKSSAAREYFGGARVKPATVEIVVRDVTRAFCDAGLLPPEAPLAVGLRDESSPVAAADPSPIAFPERVVMSCLQASAQAWDQLVSDFSGSAPRNAAGPVSGVAFGRLIVIDAALRVGAFRSYHRLGALQEWPKDKHSGLIVSRLLDIASTTRSQLAKDVRVSENTVGGWCAGARMDDENILDVANALSPRNPPRLGSPDNLASSLRRHYSWWAIFDCAAAAVGRDAAHELCAAFVRLTNAIIDGLGRSQLPLPERRLAEVTIMFKGRTFESTVYLRRHASRTESDGNWIEALTVGDLDYVTGLARRLAAIPEVRARFAGKVANPDLLDRIIAHVAASPRPGFVPRATLERAHVYRIRGDAEFSAFNRDAQAEEALLRGRFNAAMTNWRRAVELEPEKAMWHFKLGATLARAGEYEEALRECWLAAAIEPAWDLPRVEIGVIHLDFGAPEKAVEELEKARAAFPSPSAHLLHHLGVGYFRVGDLQRANEVLGAALAIEPENAMTLELAAHVAYALGDKVRGLQLAKEAAHRGRPSILEHWHLKKDRVARK